MMRIYLLLLLILMPACSNAAEQGDNVSSAQQSTSPFEWAGWPDSLWVSPDGNMAVFMYARYNFFPTILGKGAPKLEGAAPPNHHKNDKNPWSDSDLYIAFKDQSGRWSVAHNIPINDGDADCCAMIAGSEMFFQKATDLYLARYENGQWGGLEKIGLSSSAVDTNPHYDWQTKTLYWASDRGGNMDIWQAQRLGDNEWSKAEPVKGAINTAAKEDQPYVQNGKMRFSRDGASGNMLSEKTGDSWGEAKVEKLGTDLYHAEISLSADEKTAWFIAGDIKNQKMIFMQTTRQADGSWGKAVALK